MKDEYLSYIVLLEKTLADFYKKIKVMPEVEQIKNVLDFMETHSQEHAERIENAADKNKKPVLGKELISNNQNEIIRDLLDKISNEKDISKALTLLAGSEESIGLLYKKISTLMSQLSEYYKKMADEIETLANEEFDHRDLLLNDRDRLAAK